MKFGRKKGVHPRRSDDRVEHERRCVRGKEPGVELSHVGPVGNAVDGHLVYAHRRANGVHVERRVLARVIGTPRAKLGGALLNELREAHRRGGPGALESADAGSSLIEDDQIARPERGRERRRELGREWSGRLPRSSGEREDRPVAIGKQRRSPHHRQRNRRGRGNGETAAIHGDDDLAAEEPGRGRARTRRETNRRCQRGRRQGERDESDAERKKGGEAGAPRAGPTAKPGATPTRSPQSELFFGNTT